MPQYGNVKLTRNCIFPVIMHSTDACSVQQIAAATSIKSDIYRIAGPDKNGGL